MMKIVAEKSKYHRFSLYYPYDPEKVQFCRNLKDSFGWEKFSFDSSGVKRWVFSESLFVPVIKERFPETYIDPAVEEVIAQEQQWLAETKKKEIQLNEIKAKTDTDFTIKGLKKQLYPYQKVGVEFLVAAGGRAIIADSPGVGKTAQALAYIKYMGFKRSLVVCPASVKFAWKNEITKWTGLSSVEINSKTKIEDIDPDINVWLINYDILHRHFSQLSKIRFDVLIGDECQYCFPAGTMIETENGKIDIQEIVEKRIPFSVASYNSFNNKIEYKKIIGYQKNEQIAPIVRVTHRQGSFTVTGNHKIYTDNGWKEAIFLRKGDCLRTLPEIKNRQKENRDTQLSRVDSVEVLEQGSNGESSENSGKNCFVYNIEVEKNHNYFAEGVLVSNCKSIRARRTKLFRIISRNIPHIVLLSGTPLLSRPSELFSLLNILDPKTWDNFYVFARRYCNAHQTRWGLDTSGVSHQDELHARIKGYFIRRNKDEILKELPPKVFIDIPVKLDPNNSKQYDLAASDLAKFLRQYSGKQPAQIAKTLSAEKLTKKNVLRLINALGKIDVAKELIESIIDSGEKVLVFSSFVEPLNKLKEHFKDKAVMIVGTTSVSDREGIVKKFQEDPSIQVFLGGFKSAGVGITLTAASNFLAIDFPWNPADYQQSVDRMHRPGQDAKSVNIYQLFAMETIDEDLREMLNKKQKIFDQVIEGKIAKSVTKEVNEAIEKRILSEY